MQARTLAALRLAMLALLAFAGCAHEDAAEDVREKTQAVLRDGCEYLYDDCGNKIGIWCPDSPILLDMENDGFALTDVPHGVMFAIYPNAPAQMAWTAPDSDDAFLALDRDGDGTIKDGTELFGNVTEQPPGSAEEPNGYAALSVFDDDSNSQIDSNDAVWTELLLWTDTNHDGVSQPVELRRVSETAGIRFLGLRYVRTPRVDQYGNAFRYSARVGRSPGSSVSPISVDVFFLTDRPLESSDANGVRSAFSGVRSQVNNAEVVAALDTIPTCDGEFPSNDAVGSPVGTVYLQQNSTQIGWVVNLAATQAPLGIIRFSVDVYGDGYPANVYGEHVVPWSYSFHGTVPREFPVKGLNCKHKLEPGSVVEYTWKWVSVAPIPPATGGNGEIFQRCIYSP